MNESKPPYPSTAPINFEGFNFLMHRVEGLTDLVIEVRKLREFLERIRREDED